MSNVQRDYITSLIPLDRPLEKFCRNLERYKVQLSHFILIY